MDSKNEPKKLENIKEINYDFDDNKQTDSRKKDNLVLSKKKLTVKHVFWKNCLGFFLFLVSYFAIILQVVGVYLVPKDDISYVTYHAYIFYFTCFLAVVSHVRASFEDPGIITMKNNPHIVYSYIETQMTSILMTSEQNKRLKDELKNMPRYRQEEDEKEDEDTEDEEEYMNETSISLETEDKLLNEYKVNVERCNKCYALKLPKTHHCSQCKGY